MMRKTISMPDNMGEWIAARIDRGQYNNESEYFRDLVRRDQAEEARMNFLMSRLDKGDKQLSDGAYKELTSDGDLDALFTDIEKGIETDGERR